MIAGIRREIQAANSQAVITNVRTLEDVADESIADPRLARGGRKARRRGVVEESAGHVILITHTR